MADTPQPPEMRLQCCLDRVRIGHGRHLQGDVPLSSTTQIDVSSMPHLGHRRIPSRVSRAAETSQCPRLYRASYLLCCCKRRASKNIAADARSRRRRCSDGRAICWRRRAAQAQEAPAEFVRQTARRAGQEAAIGASRKACTYRYDMRTDSDRAPQYRDYRRELNSGFRKVDSVVRSNCVRDHRFGRSARRPR